MISSVFGKSKPINYIIILVFVFLLFWFVHLVRFPEHNASEDLITRIVVLGVILFSILLVNFVVRRNQISETNGYTIFYFSLLLVLFPEVLTDNNAIMTNFFFLLAMRRLISLKSLRNIRLKLFDSSFWIAISSLFYDWALLYIILVFISIYIYEPKNFKNWLVPVLSLIAAALIVYSSSLLLGNAQFIQDHYAFSISNNPLVLADLRLGGKVGLYALMLTVIGFVTFFKIRKLGIGKVVTLRLIVISLIIGFVVTILKTDSMTHPVLLTFFPASVLITKYIEVIKRVNVREITLIASLILPFAVLLTEMIVK